MNKKLRNIIIAMLLLICIAIFLIIYIHNKKGINNENNIINVEEERNRIDNEIEVAKNEVLADKPEASRIKDYVGKFYTLVDTKEYNSAYNVLFDGFKQNYFKNEKEFEEYIKRAFPKNIVLNYINLDREGKYYIATIEIIDALNVRNRLTQRVVVEEIELNKFKISFQVI